MHVNYYQDKFERDLANLLSGVVLNTKITSPEYGLVANYLRTKKYDNDVFIVVTEIMYEFGKVKITELYSEPVFLTALYGFNIFLVSNKAGYIAVLVVEFDYDTEKGWKKND